MQGGKKKHEKPNVDHFLFYPPQLLCASGQKIPRGFFFSHARSTISKEKMEQSIKPLVHL